MEETEYCQVIGPMVPDVEVLYYVARREGGHYI